MVELLTGEAGYRALSETGGAVTMTRDIITAEGPDTVKFLHSLLSQNINDLSAEARWSFLLLPQGRVVGFFRVARTGEESVRMVLEAGNGAAVHTMLSRYKIRTKCELTLEADVSVLWCSPTASTPVPETPLAGVSWEPFGKAIEWLDTVDALPESSG